MRRLLIFIIFFIPAVVFAYNYVYVYEVVTETTTFQTASKLTPVDFYMYKGGQDIIMQLKVLKVYPSKDFHKAVSDYGLEARNVKFLPHLPPPTDNRSKQMTRPYFWWR